MRGKNKAKTGHFLGSTIWPEVELCVCGVRRGRHFKSSKWELVLFNNTRKLRHKQTDGLIRLSAQ